VNYDVFSTPRLLISGTNCRTGKTLFMLGLTHELRKRKVALACAVHGPNFVSATLFKRLSGRVCRILDQEILSASQVLNAAFRSGVGADLILIDGQAGLYDSSVPGSLHASDAALAATLHAPVLLVADTKGFAQSLGALVSGYKLSAKGFSVDGLVLNYADPEEQNAGRGKDFYEAALRGFSVPPCLGVLPQQKLAQDLPQASVFQDQNRSAISRQLYLELAALIAKHVDIEAVLALAKRADELKLKGLDNTPAMRRTRIAVSDDSCFQACFQDNIDLLRYYGAEVVTFSPLADTALPRNIGGVYLSGAILGEYRVELQANEAIRLALLEFASEGGVLYAEGAGAAYLARKIKFSDGEELNGVGVLSATAVQCEPHFSYCEASTSDESIWGAPGLIVKGLKTDEWKLEAAERLETTLQLAAGLVEGQEEGYAPTAQSLASLAFFHLGSNPAVARNIVDAACVVHSFK
jgi:cobyrinic acid a,c-diamide synthase